MSEVTKRKALPASAPVPAPEEQKPEKPEHQKAMRRLMLAPSLKAAQIARKTIGYALGSGKDEGESKFTAEFHVGIEEIQEEVKAGKLGFLESMLVAQACALDSLFCKLAVMGTDQKDRANLQVVVGLALRAQNGCRATIETLAAVKNPQGFTLVKQANMAGVQQVNNGLSASPAALESFQQSKLLEAAHETTKRLDAGASRKDESLDSLVGAVAEIDRAEDARGKSPRRQKRVQGQHARAAARSLS